MNGSRNNSITTYYLRNLLQDLMGRRESVGIRFRMLGELWKPHFMQIVKITERGAIFSDESTKEFVFVPDLSDIVQIEIDDRFQELQPHFHYEVSPHFEARR
jgi:hypothetical protein